MAYRRKGGAATAKGGIYSEDYTPTYSDDSTSLAAAAIRASSAHRASSLSSAYGESALASAYRESSSNPQGFSPPSQPQDPYSYEYTSMKSLNETKSGFWGVLARKAKSAMFEDDNTAQLSETGGKTSPQFPDASTGVPFRQSYRPIENNRKTESPPFQKGLDALTSSLINIRGSIGNALEEGLTIVENRTADIISETRKLHIRRKGENSPSQNQASGMLSPRKAAGTSIPRQAGAATSTTRQAAGTATTRQPVSSSPLIQTDQETQLKASRDVAMAMAAKAKLLMRELKTIKADLAFAKERCTQLEEENKILRESRDKGDNPEDDDLIRLQLETLLAEKARLAHENSVYARENRFLREIVEYHQLTMQDVVYFDEGIEEVSEVCPIPVPPAAEVLPVPVPPSTEVCPISMPSEDQRLPSPSHST